MNKDSSLRNAKKHIQINFKLVSYSSVLLIFLTAKVEIIYCATPSLLIKALLCVQTLTFISQVFCLLVTVW